MVKWLENIFFDNLNSCPVLIYNSYSSLLVIFFVSDILENKFILLFKMDANTKSEENATEGKTFTEKQAERMKKLRELHRLRNEARSHNHQEVIAEDARNKLPPNWENRKRKAEWILNDQKEREEAAKNGEDYDRIKLLNISAVEAERLEKLRKKKNPDQGFSDFEAAAVRQYNRYNFEFSSNNNI